ncbi:hypothetical protein OROMI_006842 [Orobanche minor]
MFAQRSNSKKRKSYASMDVEKKSALLHSRRLKYRERVANRGDPGASTSNQSTQTQQIYMHRSSVIQPALLNRIEDIPLRAWSLPFSTPCPFCGAFLYLREPKGFCCLSGQISLALPTMPHELWNLYTSLDSADVVHFRKRCRIYNNTTAFSSLGITYDESLAKSNKGIYSLRIQGAVYHFIRDLIPAEGPGRQLQLYFYEPENELQNRLSQSGDLQLHILQHIVELMRRNPYALFFRGLQELPNLHEYNIRSRMTFVCIPLRVKHTACIITMVVMILFNIRYYSPLEKVAGMQEFGASHSLLLLLIHGNTDNAVVRLLYIPTGTILRNLFLVRNLKI